MRIEDLKAIHLPDCVDLFIRVFNGAPWNDKWTHEKAAGLLTGVFNTPNFVGFIAIEDGKIIGACLGNVKIWWNGNTYHIEEMYIAKEFQRSGTGSSLMKHIEEKINPKKATAISLVTGKSVYAKDFYYKNGFKTRDNMVIMAPLKNLWVV